MADPSPLTGVILVDCAKANAKSGVETAAKQCGYGSDIEAFRKALISACDQMGVTIEDLADLIADDSRPQSIGIEVAPDSTSEL